MGDALPFVQLGAGQLALEVACGFRHTCAILTGGGVKCWGCAPSLTTDHMMAHQLN